MSESLKGALIIGQSGGPSSVINASAYGVIRTALDADCITKVYGAYHGIKGVLEDSYREKLNEDIELLDVAGDEFDLEISIDETSSPTLPSHHLYIARELRKRGVEFSSMAPRFIGEFQKAIDYIGDLAEFDRQFKVHAQIAQAYGNYKVSVHSGSDKFAVYPTIGRETSGYLHLKTAGTSWLVAVTVIAQCDPALYRDMHRCALANFNDMLKLYHITADINRIPKLETLSDAELPKLMEMPEARQLLHITYGPILRSELRERFFATLHREEEAYTAAIEKHFDKHLSLLGQPRR